VQDVSLVPTKMDSLGQVVGLATREG